MSGNKKTDRSPRRKRPEKVSVTMYNVGFGDCFLLTFSYMDGERRRVLIDCGSSSKNKEHMERIVDMLVEDCQGHVDAVVITHRHRDHLSAFGIKGVGEKLEALAPDVVVQPWTEHPDAERAAEEAPAVFTGDEVNRMRGLAAAQDLAMLIAANPNRVLAAAGPRMQSQLTRIASLSIKNKKAVMRLARMGKKHAYVYAGAPSGLQELLPGVRVSVLGPPTLKQCKSIRKQTKWDETEFWKLQVSLAAASGSNVATARGHSSLFPRAQTDSISRAPSYVKWVIKKLDNAQLHNIQRIVQVLDDAMNNTSVILLFELGDKALLFPGDAQLENWQYALSHQDLKARLRKSSLLYKVGHHGSTNATPMTLWRILTCPRSRRGRLITLLSTESGHHNEVPRISLVKALRDETVLHSTEGWDKKLSEICDI